ncbi:hypothetical protein ENBRE01_0998 [Enteropsectra breve]|nr:hypothetical protein ENBRE01_0998 [Enteropsectra breve]
MKGGFFIFKEYCLAPMRLKLKQKLTYTGQQNMSVLNPEAEKPNLHRTIFERSKKLVIDEESDDSDGDSFSVQKAAFERSRKLVIDEESEDFEESFTFIRKGERSKKLVIENEDFEDSSVFVKSENNNFGPTKIISEINVNKRFVDGADSQAISFIKDRRYKKSLKSYFRLKTKGSKFRFSKSFVCKHRRIAQIIPLETILDSVKEIENEEKLLVCVKERPKHTRNVLLKNKIRSNSRVVKIQKPLRKPIITHGLRSSSRGKRFKISLHSVRKKRILARCNKIRIVLRHLSHSTQILQRDSKSQTLVDPYAIRTWIISHFIYRHHLFRYLIFSQVDKFSDGIKGKANENFLSSGTMHFLKAGNIRKITFGEQAWKNDEICNNNEQVTTQFFLHASPPPSPIPGLTLSDDILEKATVYESRYGAACDLTLKPNEHCIKEETHIDLEMDMVAIIGSERESSTFENIEISPIESLELSASVEDCIRTSVGPPVSQEEITEFYKKLNEEMRQESYTLGFKF